MGIPMAMWAVFAKSFQTQLTAVLGYDAFPLLLEKSFELRQILQDNGYRYPSGTHNRQDFIKVVGQ